MVKDKQTGFLVSKNDPRALSESILQLLRDDRLRKKMGSAARNWVHENFIWDRVAERMHWCYSDLCGSNEATAAVGAVVEIPRPGKLRAQ
jgi:hypothetical protein